MLSALDLARRIEEGVLTPAAVLESGIEAIAAREPAVGAFASLDLDAARERIRLSGAALASTPLRGLPVGIKDIFDTAELPTEYGSPIYAGHRPRADAALVSLVRRAGGIILGKTVTTEFASLQPAGTRNPHNLAHTPGGSSSGSAAAIAAGMLPIACGSQTGGSVIRPAAFCGVAGFKPSFKLLPTVGMKCYSWYLDTAGLFAAGVADLAFVAAAISGRDLRIDRREPAAPRIAVMRTQLWPQASLAMQDALARAARCAETAGAVVKDLPLPRQLEDAYEAHAIVHEYEVSRALAFEYDHHREQLSPLLRERIERGAAIDAESYDAARRTTRLARRVFADIAADFDAILTPSAAGAAPAGLTSTGAPTFNKLWTLLGNPCVNVPGLVDADGMPLGVQIVGRFARDRAALEAALFLEHAISDDGRRRTDDG
jgi:Asp-tRNA(Asn)/Glu-tRNA(Gln) amidotransferase A subunit family amidase